MPVILQTQQDIDKWLDPSTKFKDVQNLLKPLKDGLKWIEVDPFVNKIANNTAECIVPAREKSGSLFKFLKPQVSNIPFEPTYNASVTTSTTTTFTAGTTAPDTLKRKFDKVNDHQEKNHTTELFKDSFKSHSSISSSAISSKAAKPMPKKSTATASPTATKKHRSTKEAPVIQNGGSKITMFFQKKNN
ncbi:hypothetical protein BDR26DRAFT_553783 [Obelidium mucronatum]|nr:hypothetical protein BDR26DRAFT_553783 [Obelidium mucronatum]